MVEMECKKREVVEVQEVLTWHWDLITVLLALLLVLQINLVEFVSEVIVTVDITTSIRCNQNNKATAIIQAIQLFMDRIISLSSI